MDHVVVKYLIEVVALILATGFLLFIMAAAWSILFRHFPIWQWPPTRKAKIDMDSEDHLAPGDRLRRKA